MNSSGQISYVVVILLTCGFVVGCDFKPSQRPFSAEITDKSGTDKLALIYTNVGVGPVSNSESFQFRSLVWKVKVGTNWNVRVEITKEQFQSGSSRPRWVSEIHSFDPPTSNAIIKVAEESPQQTNGVIACVYSWREWNLARNSEVRLLRICKEPFEPF